MIPIVPDTTEYRPIPDAGIVLSLVQVGIFADIFILHIAAVRSVAVAIISSLHYVICSVYEHDDSRTL